MMKSMLPDVSRVDGAVAKVQREIHTNLTQLAEAEKKANVSYSFHFAV